MSHDAWYNENNPYAAQWLRNLIRERRITKGEVCETDIRAVDPDASASYWWQHLFAGIGGWDVALRLADWPRGLSTITCSCPCQPFSGAAHKPQGQADERHLWPAAYRYIAAQQPAVVFGEQVAGPAGRQWLDDVCADMEKLGYACWAADIPACGVGAPHIRQRIFWVALADAARQRGEKRRCAAPNQEETAWLIGQNQGRGEILVGGETRGFWQEADWLRGDDDRWRPVEPGTFPLAYGVPARLERCRAYGNAIVPQAAAAFCRAVKDVWL